MALPRLHAIFHSYVLDYLDPTGELRQEPNEILLETPKRSVGVLKAYTHNKALTLFLGKPAAAELTLRALGTSNWECLNGNLRYVDHNDTDHENYHISTTDYDEDHTHFLKNKKPPHPMLSLKDVQCILDGVKAYQHGNKMCLDGENRCLLSEHDQQKIRDGYEKYLKQKKAAPELQAAVEKLSNELENRCITGAKTFTQAFLTTFLEKYIKPYLISKFHCPNTTRWGIEMIKSGITFGLNKSLLNTALDAIIRNGLQSGLQKAGVNPDVVNQIATEIGSIIAFTQNPLSLIELGINGSAAAAGQTAAYQLIRLLPKLKYEEPAPAESVTAHVINDESMNMPSSLRHRK